MAAGKCPNCSNDYKNLGAHKCKNTAMKPVDNPTLLKEPTPTQAKPIPNHTKAFEDAFKIGVKKSFWTDLRELQTLK